MCQLDDPITLSFTTVTVADVADILAYRLESRVRQAGTPKMPVFRPTGLHPPLLDYDQLTNGDHKCWRLTPW
jgi:hypothetical protein